MGLLDLFFKTPEPKILKSNDKIFATSKIGGIKVNVSSLLNSNYVRFESFAKNSYLKKFIINPNDELKIGNYVVMIFNFGIVNNTSLIDDEEGLIRCVTFQFRDAKKFMFDDIMQDDVRINKIESSNSFVFNWAI